MNPRHTDTSSAAQIARAQIVSQRMQTMSAEDRDTVALIIMDVMDALANDDSGGLMFVDPEGTGEMNIHLFGDKTLAAHMLRHASEIYENIFTVSAGETVQ